MPNSHKKTQPTAIGAAIHSGVTNEARIPSVASFEPVSDGVDAKNAIDPLGNQPDVVDRGGELGSFPVARVFVGPPSSIVASRDASNDNRPTDVKLDQYYTRQEVADRCYEIFKELFDPARHQMVEPSAGTGAFYVSLPAGSIGLDVDPKHPDILAADFLKVTIESPRPVAFIGNPPYGRNASTAVGFFNHAARQSNVVALILPRTFRKASVVNRLDRAFRLVREEEMPADAFLFRSKPFHLDAVFQVWRRDREPRETQAVETRHPDFEFTTPDRADFAIQRVGARAGRVHRDLTRSPSSHYFIRGDVEAIMRRLDFGRFTGNVAGNPSLARSEIVALYREYVASRGGSAG